MLLCNRRIGGNLAADQTWMHNKVSLQEMGLGLGILHFMIMKEKIESELMIQKWGSWFLGFLANTVPTRVPLWKRLMAAVSAKYLTERTICDLHK